MKSALRCPYVRHSVVILLDRQLIRGVDVSLAVVDDQHRLCVHQAQGVQSARLSKAAVHQEEVIAAQPEAGIDSTYERDCRSRTVALRVRHILGTPQTMVCPMSPR